MTSTKMRARTTLGVALAGMAAVLGLLVSPAAAQTSGPGTSGGARATDDSVASGTCVAVDNSVCSGSGLAVDDSVSSGSAVARDGSVASGCSTAIDDSTASGAPCPPTRPVTTVVKEPGPGPRGPAARVATPTSARTLALTGSSSAELAGLAVVVLALGGVLFAVGSRRPLQS